jgi:hypothetical protein
MQRMRNLDKVYKHLEETKETTKRDLQRYSEALAAQDLDTVNAIRATASPELEIGINALHQYIEQYRGNIQAFKRAQSASLEDSMRSTLIKRGNKFLDSEQNDK